MKIKTSELTRAALEWAVAVALGHQPIVVPYRNSKGCIVYKADWARQGGIESHYSTDWAQGGPLIEREQILLEPQIGKEGCGNNWAALSLSGRCEFGPTPLIAAMRCLIASKLGNKIEIPDDLLEN